MYSENVLFNKKKLNINDKLNNSFVQMNHTNDTFLIGFKSTYLSFAFKRAHYSNL